MIHNSIGVWLIFSSVLPAILGVLAWRYLEVCTAMFGFAIGLAVGGLVMLLTA